MTARLWITVVAALLALTAAVVIVDGPLPGEVGLIRWLQDLGEPVPSFAEFFQATTGTEGNLVLVALVAPPLARRHGRSGLVAVAVCAVAMLVVQPASKEIVDRDRPSAEQVEVRAEHSSRSYPSGHSLGTSTTWGAAALYARRVGRRRLALLFLAPVACTAVASNVNGVHWASDSIAGTIMGVAAAWLAVGRLDLDHEGVTPPPTG